MNTEEQFEQLKKLLALKRHEQPPPGYFDRLPRQICAAIEAEQAARNRWFSRMWSSLQAKPAFGGVLALGMCGMIVAGIFLAGKTGDMPGRNGGVATTPKSVPQTALTTQLAVADNSSTNPVSSAQPPPFLFDYSLIQSGGVHQPVPVDLEFRPQ